MLAASVMVNGVIALLHAGFGLAGGRTITTTAFLYTGPGGAASYGFASILWRAYTRLTRSVTIHATGTLTPLFSVAWLLMACQAENVIGPLRPC